MGGLGSGNRNNHWWRGPKKTTVEECLSLDAARLTREGVLKAGGQTGTWRWTYASSRTFAVNYCADVRPPDASSFWLWYSWTWGGTSEVQSADYCVRLAATRPRFGGLRWWFLCPIAGCSRRARKLYLPPRARYFGCRRCHDLTYRSCQECHHFDGLYRLMGQQLGVGPAEAKRTMREVEKRWS